MSVKLTIIIEKKNSNEAAKCISEIEYVIKTPLTAAQYQSINDLAIELDKEF